MGDFHLRVLSIIPESTSSLHGMVFAKKEIEFYRRSSIEVQDFFLKSRTSFPVLISEWWRLKTKISHFNPDVVHCHFGTMTAFFAACSTLRPLVVTFRGSDLNPVPGSNQLRTIFAHCLSHLAAVRAKKIICVSCGLRSRLFWGRAKAKVIPTGVDSEIFMPISQKIARQKLGWKHNSPVVLFNSGISPQVKRLDLAESAVEEVCKTIPGVKLVVLKGEIPINDMPLYYNAADVLLLTSDYEGSPTVVQEAVSCGLPVVAVPVGDVLTLLYDVFPSKIVSRNVVEIGEGLREILCSRRRSNGHDVALKRFSHTALSKKRLRVLYEATAKTFSESLFQDDARSAIFTIWLVAIGEPVPLSAGATARLHRAGQFAKRASSEVDVVWWTSAFDHFCKKFIADSDSDIQASEHLQIKAMRAVGYKSNISVRRVQDQRILARKMLAEMRNSSSLPDVILVSAPPMEIASATIRYAKSLGIPVVLDLRDMWPDIFINHAPRFLRPLLRLALLPMFKEARRVCHEADAIIGITDSFVEWGLKKAGRQRGKLDKAFPFAYNTGSPAVDKLAEADDFWDSLGVFRNDSFFTVCFFGSIGRQFDFKTIFDAFLYVGDKARLVVCGNGDKFEYVKRLAKGQKNILFPGWVDSARIYSLMRRSNAGLDPLPERYDFLASINNKAVEYLSAGLPVISSPGHGELFNLLQKYQCGISFSPGDSAALADIILKLAASPLEVALMAKGAAKCFQDNFVAERVHSDMLSHLKLIAEQCKQKA